MRGRKPTDGKRGGAFHASTIATAIFALFAFAGADASAAIRYAAPGATNTADSGCPQSNPCSLSNAADRFVAGTTLGAGDEIVVEPGNYALGPQETIIPAERTSIHGVVGQARPILTTHGDVGSGAFLVNRPGVTLSWLEIISPERRTAIDLLSPGVVDGVIARGGRDSAPCVIEDGVIRNTACISTGDGGSALKIEMNTDKTDTVRVRNVTAIATGANSRGLVVRAFSDVELNVDAVGVLARGTAEDVFAGAFSVPPMFPIGARVTVNLSHSDFADVKPENDPGGGTATITAPGQGNGNITAEPLLAADGYHELPRSPTIDAGAVDPSSGPTDVDGNARSIGAAPDIGADELQLVGTMSLTCAPRAAVRDRTPCTVTVSAAGGSPTGTVRFSSDGPGSFTNGASCTLARGGKAEVGLPGCDLTYTPSAVGSGRHAITASYSGDASHVPSQGSAIIRVLTKSQATPNTTLKRKPPRKTAGRKATFTFASDTPHSLFECKLDRQRFHLCRPPVRLKHVKRGRHTFSVRARGPTGIPDPSPARFRWTVS